MSTEDVSAKKVIVFIPAYNEENDIEQVIKRLHELYAGSDSKGFIVELLVVDDGSTDETATIVRRNNVRLISHPRNIGLGAATRTALEAAYERGAYVAVKFDADMQHAPEDIEKVIRPIIEDKADIVYGSRFAGEIRYKMPLVRYIGNKFFTKLMRMMTGWAITDAQTGLMAYGRNYMKGFNMPGDYNPPQQTLIDAYHRHLRYAEVPVVFSKRTQGKSFISYHYPFQVLVQLLRILVMVNPLKVFIPISLILWTIAISWLAYEFYLITFIDESIKFHKDSMLLLLTAGLQIFTFGLLADLIVNKK